MWARVAEVALGCWLALSPFIFEHASDAWSFWTNDLACAALIATISLSSLWSPLRHLHLAGVVVALWLIGFGVVMSSHPVPPALQNNVMIGLLLGMFALVPSEASVPPTGWRTFAQSTRR